jgi:hypothetical protein
MLDSVRLYEQIQPHQRVLVLCPRRSRKTSFLSTYIDGQCADTVYMGLSTELCRFFELTLSRRGVLCTAQGSARTFTPQADYIRRSSLLVLDEALFMNERGLFPLFGDQRIVALSTPSPDPQALQRFIAAGFVVIDAPLLYNNQ